MKLWYKKVITTGNYNKVSKMKVIMAVVIALSAALPPTKLNSRQIHKHFLDSPASRIIGGDDIKRFQFPYQVSLLYYIDNKFYHGCGGTLISESRVLTAAHCVPHSLDEFLLAFGMLSLDQIKHPDVQIRHAKEFRTHPAYIGGKRSGPNDIAIIVLSEPVKLTPAVQIAKLGTEDDCNAMDRTLFSGWGAVSWEPTTFPRILQYVELPRISFLECVRRLINITGTSKPLDKTQLCTSPNPGLSQSICRSDSGGPLVRLSNKRLIGVAAWAIYPCRLSNAPSMYTNICSHFDFINNNQELI